MTEWKDPQERAEEEDAARSMPFCEQVDRWLHGDAPQECRECEDGKYAELCDGSDRRGCLDDGTDTREKLEADVSEWCESSNAVFTKSRFAKIIGWLDRQAAITRAERDAYWEECVDDLNYNCTTCESKAELRGRLEDHIANGDRLFNALIDTTAERDRLLEQLNRVWLKDADGKPLHIGETRYGEDGTGWRVTGFRWGSSHPVQGVDKEGRRRDLRPEWLRSERPDSLGSLLEDVRRGALAYPRDRITGYLEDNHSIGEAVLLDVRDRIEKLAGGSE